MTEDKNAFDLLRLLLASGVILAHSYLLGGYKSADFLTVLSKGQTSLADVCVMGFFVLSGYLITASFQRSKYLTSFVVHRLLRVYPGYWVCLLASGIGFAYIIAILANGNANSFNLTGPSGSLSYFYHNFFIRVNQWSVGNVLNKSAYNESLNGSLWSLYPEIQCYVLTLLLGCFGLFNKNKLVIVLLLAFTLFVFASKEVFKTDAGPSFLYLSNALKLHASYLAGTIYYLYRTEIGTDKKLVVFVTLFAGLLIKFGGFSLISPILIGYLLISIFKLFAIKLKYDLSYGVYIYGFPTQQALFLLIGNKLPVIVFAIIALSMAVIISFLSFIFIERPFIRLKKPIDNYILVFHQRYFKRKLKNS